MSSITETTYQPTFFVERLPDRFGNNQSDYLAKSNQYIGETATRLLTARKNGEDLTQLFFTVIADLSSKRSQLAKAHRTEDSEDFGQRRDQSLPGRTSYLLLTHPYDGVGNKLLKLFADRLSSMLINGKFMESLKIVDKCNGRTSTLDIQVISKEKLEAMNIRPPREYLPSFIPLDILYRKTPLTADEKTRMNALFARFKKELPDMYRQRRFASAVRSLANMFPSPSSLNQTSEAIAEKLPPGQARFILNNTRTKHVHVVLRTNVDGVMYNMTEYFTWLYESLQWVEDQDPEEHPLKCMLECSKVLMMQQDVLLIQKTLEEIAKVFKRAMLWTREQPLSDLKNTMAEFCYLAAHNMRDIRGTAAETEWLERAIYNSHGVEYSLRDKGKLVDLEAFANPLFSEFVKEYDKMVELKLIDVS